MSGQQEEADGLYVQHQYMCSECHQLFNTLEEVLVHQQSHTGLEGEGGEEAELGATQVHITDAQAMGESQYQCLECGTLLRTPEELLLHQELHMREAGMETEHHELCEVVESGEAVTAPPVSGQIQYQCLECLALFDTPEVWLAHRQTHSKSSTHSALSDTEFVLQADGSVTPLVSVQNLVLSEQRAGEILTLAQVLAAQQQSSPLPPTPSRGTLLPSPSGLPASATLRLQICTAQALADGSTVPGLRRAKLLPPLLPAGSPLEPGAAGRPGEEAQPHFQRLEVALSQGQPGREGQEEEEEEAEEAGEVVIIHPYECSECALLFQTPEDFLQHQGEHFLAQDKESGEEGVMEGAEDEELEEMEEEVRPEENGGAEEERPKGAGGAAAHRRQHSAFLPPRPRQAPAPPLSLQCGECQRTFTSANRLSAHRRVHEHGTHECPECDKVFKKPASLQTHMRTHSGEARFLCMDCGHGFTTEMTLIIHRKSHTAEPLHRCQFCAKTFTNMTKFLYHRRTHTARAPLAPITMVSAVPQRVPLSHLSILQRAREREEAVLRGREGPPESAAPAPVPPGQAEAEPESDAGGAASQAKGAGGENGLDAEHGPAHGQETRGGEDTPAAGSPAHPAPPAAADASAGSSERTPGPPAPHPRAPAFPCPSCGKAFPTQLCLVRHRRTVHVSERRFKCGVCGKPFKKQIHVRNHLRVHTGERPFQCSDCGKTFSSLANLSRHGLTHSGLRPYRCDVCHKAFTQSSNLRQHRLLHANPAPFPCPDCPAAFLRPAKLAAHRYAQHPGAPAPYPCPRCPAGFLRKRQRDRHCLETHPEAAAHHHADGLPDGSAPRGSEAPPPPSGPEGGAPGDGAAAPPLRAGLECGVCGKRLNSAANLRLHQLSHGRRRAGASPAARAKGHQCPVCGKLFVSSSGVVLHQRVHTGERPFPCPQCGKRFRQNTHLREHLRTHSGERPFRCELCGKGFVQSMHLAEHRRTHTGERPHACAVCGKAFKTFSNLRSHRKTHARAPPEEGAAAAAAAAAIAVVDASSVDLAGAVPALCQQGEVGQPQLIQIQTQQGQNTPTIMCNEFGETIAIIETSEGGALPLAEAIEIYQTALENSLGMDSITVDSLQLL
ncbi:zinc finger protein 574 [Anguilla rostrata]|uniref:zinc finger protein 574 n=1 Tax=Anguilla rostrata TaxID=7938 RepID=UPI0030CCF52D